VIFFAVEWIAISAVASGAAALATCAVVIVALLQRSDSRESAEAAIRAAQAAEAGVELQRTMYEEQSKLSLFPPLAVDFFLRDERVWVRITNPGTVPALEVDVVPMAVIWAETLEPSDRQEVRGTQVRALRDEPRAQR
jgi:hypothetical protein